MIYIFFQPIRYKKRGRRVRVDSINSNCSDEEKPKKKKKNAMTKAEVRNILNKCVYKYT